MDYPKRVPSVGLVNGKFVDENPVTGAPGSLIPAQWGECCHGRSFERDYIRRIGSG